MEMKTIKQVSNELNITTQAIYNKINKSLKLELQDHIKKVNGQIFIDEFGFNLMKERIQLAQTVSAQAQIEDKPEAETTDQFAIILQTLKFAANGENKLLIEQMISMREEITFLKKEIDSKNKLLAAMSGEIQKEQEFKRSQSDKIIGLADQLTELVRNNQVLLREAQEKTSVLVTEQFGESEEFKKNAEKKGFFKKRFNKNK